MDLSGVFLPVTTPFHPTTGEVDRDGLRFNLERWARAPVQGVVLAGTTGEGVLLDEAERVALVEVAREVLPPHMVLSVGTGLESTRATIRLCRAAAEAGAQAVLVQPPAYYRGAMTPEALREHYWAVADASPVPVIVYQAPLRMSTLDLPTGLVAELSRHGNIVGIKDSRGKLELVGELVGQCRRGFAVLVGSGAHLYAGMEVGAVGGIVAVADLAPEECGRLFQAYRAGRTSEAGRLQERLGPLHQDLVAGMGIGGVKAALDLLGYRGGPPRPPLRPLPEGRRGEVRELLVRAGLLAGA